MEGKQRMYAKKEKTECKSLVDVVFSWSIRDILNRYLYKGKVQKIPETFSSTIDYLKSFESSLIEETHADLSSSMAALYDAPTRQIYEANQSKYQSKSWFYDIYFNPETDTNTEGEKYVPSHGDLIALTGVIPKCIDDLETPTNSFLLAYVKEIDFDNTNVCSIVSSNPIIFQDAVSQKRKKLFVVYLTNLTTNVRIWKALHPDLERANFDILNKVVQTTSHAGEECTECLSEGYNGEVFAYASGMLKLLNLNRSQESAIMSCIRTHSCRHNKTVKLIWGPPGTGKTKTVSLMLFAMLKLKCRTLTCTPTNTAVLEVASRVLRLVRPSLEYESYGLGDIVLFGNEKRMKIDEDHDYLLDVFLDHRVEVLYQCLRPLYGWKPTLESMISLLDDARHLYHLYLETYTHNHDDEKDLKSDLHKKEKPIRRRKSSKGKNGGLKKAISEALAENEVNKFSQQSIIEDPLTFDEFVKKKFYTLSERLQFCMVNMYTHLPTSVLSLQLAKDMIMAIDILQTTSASEVDMKNFFDNHFQGNCKRDILLKILNSLPRSFIPDCQLIDEIIIKRFCLQNACLIFSTVSTSSTLQTSGMKPIELLIIDEAAQLKECESTIPLQLYGLRNAILIGDEFQLPAMVTSEMSKKAEFGRSLFERLVLLGHKKHLLDVQYRMHPSISLFPNTEFYDGQIVDAANVKAPSYEKRFLTGDMYGPYSFINVGCGAEEFHRGHSKRNMVEVAVVNHIVSNLYKEYTKTKRKMSIGVISPYKAQTNAMEDVIGKKYSSNHAGSGFTVSIRSVDGFQGGEEDVIIMSTVRCNANGSVGFLSNHQRANVALTRARYCLWILGNEATLMNSNSIWTRLIVDAKKRGCFYNADDDISLTRAITTALIEFGRCDLLLNMNSLSFKTAKWNVCYSIAFRSSMSRIRNPDTLKEMLSLLEKLSSGWRLKQKGSNIKFNCDGVSSQMLEIYPLDNHLNIIWTVDIIKEHSYYTQILKVWDILPLSGVHRLARHLDNLYGSYSVDMISRCKDEHVMGNHVVPKSWRVNSFAAIQSNEYEDDSVLRLTDKITSLSIQSDEDKASYSETSNIKHLKPTWKKIEGDGMKDRN